MSNTDIETVQADTDFESLNFLDFMAGSMQSGEPATVTGLLNAYVPVFMVAFLVSILVTPLIRRLALDGGVVDHPDEARKVHRFPVAYLGGLAVLFGLSAGLAYSYIFIAAVPAEYNLVPFGVLAGAFAIAVTGFMDDVWGWDPRLKIAGQLVAAAGLAISDVGVNVATGALFPIFGSPESVLFVLGDITVHCGQLYYWVGTALIAIFVIGGCNAANLIDGLDGLLTGSASIMALAFLAIALLMATDANAHLGESNMAGARIVITLSLLGALLGFLPYNFNPAVIFLGDCGSLLIGYICVVIILMLGEQGQTHLVIAGLIVFTLPIMDTLLAIIRRKLAGNSMSEPDSDHMHHMLLRGLGSVRKAVFTLYGITAVFGVIGVLLTFLFLHNVVRGGFVYAAFVVLFSFIVAVAYKTGQRRTWVSTNESQ